MECHSVIVAGFGFSSRATVESLRGALVATGQEPDAVATLADKVALLAGLGLPVIVVTGPLPDTPTQSTASIAARGTGSVAEACALAGAGPGAYLLTTRKTSPDGLATCAIAKGRVE